MTHRLLCRWGLAVFYGRDVSEDMLKVAFQIAEEHIADQLKKGSLAEGELPPILLQTNNADASCPYKISNIAYPKETTFKVDLGKRSIQTDISNAHPNIQLLIARMDDALDRDDYAGVLHASASIFETMAKDIVAIPGVQNQTLKSFFDRYRKDSNLPTEILDYILEIYDLRNTTPLAGHGSIQTPAMSRDAAITLSEMSRAFIRIEYRLHQRQP